MSSRRNMGVRGTIGTIQLAAVHGEAGQKSKSAKYLCGGLQAYRKAVMTREPLVEDIQDYALNIVDTVREPLLILDTTLRVRSANRAFYQTFQVSSEETVDHLIYE